MAPRERRVYQCAACGAESPKWAGQCPECGAWNTLSETVAAPAGGHRGGYSGAAGQAEVVALADVEARDRKSVV